jgi:hypothetical protein
MYGAVELFDSDPVVTMKTQEGAERCRTQRHNDLMRLGQEGVTVYSTVINRGELIAGTS